MIIQLRPITHNLTQRKARLVKLRPRNQVAEIRASRQPINQHVQIIVLPYPPINELGRARFEGDWIADGFARLVLRHVQPEGRALYAVAEEDAAERFRLVYGSAFGWAEAEGMVVVVEGEDGAHGCVALRGGWGEVVYI